LKQTQTFSPIDSVMNNLRYPDPAIEILDPSFLKYRLYAASVEQLATGFRWAEGPVWFGDGRYLLFSDIPNNRIMRYDDTSGATSVFRTPANYANGHSRDRQGRLISCEHGTRAIMRTEYDGSITVLADKFEGKRLNSPNDIVCKSDGSIWFTDPPFGVLGHYEGDKAALELPHGVYRIDGTTGNVTRVVDEVQFPNGLCFSPDEKTLYLIGRIDKEPTRYVFAFDVVGDSLANRKVLINAGVEGALDGMRCDEDGNIWAGFGFTGAGTGTSEALDGVRVFNPQGKAIGHIHLPERCANLCFGGAKGNRLFMASSHSLYSLYVETKGAV
jgi:gluconolactonase